MSDSILFQALIYLAAAVLCVPVAKRLGLGSVLGYLLAGVIIGPDVLGLVGNAGHVMHFAEFGVVMMLFLVGLELKPSTVWQLRRPIFGLGGMQVAGTAALVTGAGLALGFSWQVALAVGMVLAMSSTAIVLQSLGEKGLLKTEGGQASFSVLLFQDLSVIPILAVFPLLAAGAAVVGAPAQGARPGWLQGLLILGAVGLIVVAGRTVVRPLFRFLAGTRLREVFTAFALFLVVSIAWLMQQVGLSPALGTFLAGVVLAESEYRHELESDIEPFKGLLLGLFFISVGAEIDFHLIAEAPLRIAGLLVGVIALKAVSMLGFSRIFKLDRPARWLVSVGLSQVGEFAFVLISFGQASAVFGDEVAKPLVAVVALSMLVTPALFVLLERVILPRVTAGAAKREHDAVAHDDAQVVVAGFGRVGQVVARMLRMSGFGVTVLDLDPEMVDLLRRLGQKVYYGDASRLDLLVSAGCEKAKLFVLCIDEPDKSMEVAELVRRHFPKLPILARARNRQHYIRLWTLGIRDIIRETMGSSLELSEHALRNLGVRAHTAHRIANRWRAHDEKALLDMMKFVGGPDRNAFFAEARKAMENFEKTMREELQGTTGQPDKGWDNESLRNEANARFAAVQAQAAKASESSTTTSTT
ncbi:MAG: monovalent cation:proton antiporter-2 (CPA2) family protein [Myxococcaceae bacterium]|nr:monovalent cation:proton antiporter-2 (CPA2) family protein [Myxococcaceae bacterium]